MPSGQFNIWDQAAFTLIVQAAVDNVLGEGRERVANQFAPLEGTRVDKIALEKVKIKAVGRGSIIADDATPPIYRPETKLVQEAFELLRISEMTPVEESLRRQLELNGSDPESVERRKRAGLDILTRARAIQVRNENQSDWMVMQAILFGVIPIKVANPTDTDTSTEYNLDYEFAATHLPTVSTSWANLAASAPITYLRAWQSLLRQDSGSWGIHIYLSSEVMDLILNSQQVKDTINPINLQSIPTAEAVKNLLYEPDRVEFHVIDSGWYEEAAGYNTELDADKTRWIPKDRLLITTEDPHKGQRIAQMFDGMVPVQTDWNNFEYRGPGAQSSVQLIGANYTYMNRNEMRRVPMVHQPECIVSAKVVL